MKYLYSKYLQRFIKAKTTLPIIVSTTILSSLIAQPSRAFNITFSFSSDAEYSNNTGMSATGVINEWDRGSGLQDGWQPGNSTGTATDSTTVQITFTGAPRNSNSSLSNNLIGDARTNTQNFNFDSKGPVTTKGMKIEDINFSNDGNVTTLNQSGSIRELVGGTLANSQLLTFKFSEPIIIDSDTRFFIDDIDDNSTTGASESYIDALGVEAFNSPNVGTPGTGINRG